MSSQNQAINVYRSTEINTGDVGNLIILLYEGAITQLRRSIEHFGNYKKYDVLSAHLRKSQEIVEELLCSLDMNLSGELPKRLQSIYMYVLSKIRNIHLETGKKDVCECADLLEDLLLAWKQVYVSSKANPGKGQSDNFSGKISYQG